MKKVVLFLVCMVAVASQAVVIDDFSDGDLSDYTATVILDTDAAGGANDVSWEVAGGALQVVTNNYQSIEQSAFIKNGYTLSVGEELTVDIAHNGASQDLGLFVGLAPEFNNRREYINVYARNSSEIYSRGFSNVVSGEMNLKGGVISESAYDKLFLARDGEYDYEAGYYNGDTRVVIADRNGLSFGGSDDLVIGLYTDIRAVGTLASADNLSIVPEPATMALLSLGGFLAVRKRK